eukprot:g5913.t1
MPGPSAQHSPAGGAKARPKPSFRRTANAVRAAARLGMGGRQAARVGGREGSAQMLMDPTNHAAIRAAARRASQDAGPSVTARRGSAAAQGRKASAVGAAIVARRGSSSSPRRGSDVAAQLRMRSRALGPADAEDEAAAAAVAGAAPAAAPPAPPALSRKTTNSRIVSRVARAAAMRRRSLVAPGGGAGGAAAPGGMFDGGGRGGGDAGAALEMRAALDRRQTAPMPGRRLGGAGDRHTKGLRGSAGLGRSQSDETVGRGTGAIARRGGSQRIQASFASAAVAADSRSNSRSPDEESDDEDPAVVLRALALIQRLDRECVENGSASVTKDDLRRVLEGFELAFSLGNDAESLKVEDQLQHTFRAMPDIFDSDTKGFLQQEYFTAAGGNGAGGSGVGAGGKDGQYDVQMLVRAHVAPAGHRETMGLLDGLQGWGFDIFRFQELAPTGFFAIMGIAVLEAHDLFNTLQLNQRVVRNWLIGMQQQYNDNPYHNATHAMDVTQTLHHFMTEGGLGTHLPPHTTLAAILAAVTHDCGHPGVTNAFLINTRDPLALKYSYRSPLESLHASLCFQTMALAGCDVLGTARADAAPLPPLTLKQVRETIVEMVISTDNSVHSVVMGRLKAKVDFTGAGVGFCMQDHGDQLLSLCVALHTADVSNPAKPMPIYREWTRRVLSEFYAQGDKEKSLGMPVSPGCDREKVIPAEKFQAGFIVALVLPLYREFSTIPGVTIETALEQLQDNLAFWRRKVGRKVGMDAATKARAVKRVNNLKAFNEHFADEERDRDAGADADADADTGTDDHLADLQAPRQLLSVEDLAAQQGGHSRALQDSGQRRRTVDLSGTTGGPAAAARGGITSLRTVNNAIFDAGSAGRKFSMPVGAGAFAAGTGAARQR